MSASVLRLVLCTLLVGVARAATVQPISLTCPTGSVTSTYAAVGMPLRWLVSAPGPNVVVHLGVTYVLDAPATSYSAMFFVHLVGQANGYGIGWSDYRFGPSAATTTFSFGQDLTLPVGVTELRFSDGPTGAPTLNPATGLPLVITVAVDTALPTDDPPSDVRVAGLDAPVQVTAATGVVPAATFADNTPGAYVVTWDFGTPIALVDGSSMPQQTVRRIAAATVAGDRLSVAYDHALTFASAGVYPVTVTVQEVATAASAASSGDDALVVFDPYAGVSASGKGKLADGAGKPAKFDLVVANRSGATNGRLDFTSDVAGVKFRADAFTYLAASGGIAASGGTGTLNGVAGTPFRLLVDDAANRFGLVLLSADGASVVYTFGPVAIDPTDHGDIVVNVPPNG